MSAYISLLVAVRLFAWLAEVFLAPFNSCITAAVLAHNVFHGGSFNGVDTFVFDLSEWGADKYPEVASLAVMALRFAHWLLALKTVGAKGDEIVSSVAPGALV